MYAGPDPARHGTTAGGAGQRGATLIVVVLFIVIVSIALTSVVNLLAVSALRSSDPVLTRQSLAIAESLLQEILSQPAGSTDPDGGADTLGPEAGETRTSPTLPFDNINDYDGYSMTGVVNADGSTVPGLSAYSASVSVRAQGFDGLPSNGGWLVTVTVTAPDGSTLALSGFKARLQ
jgi:MSHA pilin protein MshD